MNVTFQKTSSHWVKYSEYEIKKAPDGELYVTSAPKSKLSIYDPLKEPETLVLDALNVGMLCMKRASSEKIREAVMEFVPKYGLMGFITALPNTPQFMDYEAAYLPTNHFIKAESMPAKDYTSLFFPFSKPDLRKNKADTQWNLVDREMIALALTMGHKPMAESLSFQRDYAERYDWLVTQFKDLAFSFVTSIFYYEDYDEIDETTRDLYRQGMAAFGGNVPTYHIALLDRPTIVWDFHSLLLAIQMMFSFMLTDKEMPLRSCKHCNMAFAATHQSTVFCSPRCKNQYNVYKSRGKKE